MIEELIAAGRYRLTDIFRRTRTRYISLPEMEIDPGSVRNMYVRRRTLRMRGRDCYLTKELPNLQKVFLIIRVINGFILGIASIKNFQGMEIG